MNARKRLFFDIETAPNIGFFWSAGHDLEIGPHNIIKERAIICIGYKWAGEKKVDCLTWDTKQCDKQLLSKFLPIFNKADEVVSHNGDRFDIPWIRTRCLLHGIPMMPNPVSIDTLKTARAKFKFNSNRLDYVAGVLGLGHKLPTGFDLWKDIVLKKSKPALAKMARYCKRDVVLLERVWDALNPYVQAKTHYGRFTSDCPECKSSHTKVKMHRVTAAGHRQVQLQCSDCGKYHTIAASREGKEI